MAGDRTDPGPGLTGRFVLRDRPAGGAAPSGAAGLSLCLEISEDLARLFGPPRVPRPKLDWREIRL